MTDKICILFSGIDSLGGSIAIQLVQAFALKEYGAVKMGQVGKLWYGDFDSVILKNTDLRIINSLVDLLLWLGSRKIKFRFDRSNLQDSQVDFQLHMIQEKDYITIPEVEYFNG